MSRRFIYDNDTMVGYSVLQQAYYVINKDTYTYRETAEEIKKVVDIVAPGNVYTVVQLKKLASTPELLTDLYYTIHDTGAYISSVQINDYDKFPLVLDCDKQVLYIGNSEVVFNLTLNESRELRVIQIIDFYKDVIGVFLTIQEVTAIYNFLIERYRPYVYNVIQDTTATPVVYSNIFALSNWNNKSKAVYNCTLNPYNKFTLLDTADIIYTDTSYNTVTCINPTPGILNLKKGDTVYIQGTETDAQTYTYTADGEYTVYSIETNDTDTRAVITLQEAVPASYTFPYPEAYLQTGIANIASISREDSTITLTTAVPDQILIGDIIEVYNTQQTIEDVSVSCNGNYTVAEIIDSNIIRVQETIPANYLYTTGTQGSISKNIFISNVATVTTNTVPPLHSTIVLTQASPVQLQATQHLFIKETTGAKTYYTLTHVTSQAEVTGITEFYTGESPLHIYTPVYPQLQIQEFSTEILIEVTSTQNPEIFPTGEFMVDNFAQCQSYISLYPDLTVPELTVYNNINEEVGGDIAIAETLPTCKYLGIFSQVYVQK